MSDINLLQNQSTITAVKTRSKRWLFNIVAVLLVLGVLGYGYLLIDSYLTKKNITKTQADIAVYQQQLQASPQREELLTRQGQLKSANQLIAAHLYWSALLPELARVTLGSAKYSTIDVDKDGKLNLTVTVPSYTDAELYLQIFDLPEYNQKFSDVKVLALTKEQKDSSLQTTMRLQLTLNPDLLKK